MKKVVKISVMTATVAVAMMFFGGCKKTPSTPSLVSGGFNGKINATVEKESQDLTSIKWVVPWNEPGVECEGSSCRMLGKQMGEPVSFSNYKFTIDLPKTVPSSIDMYSVKYVFETGFEVTGTLKYSDPKVMLAAVDFLAYTGEFFVGSFHYRTSDKKTICIFVYAESDVTVTGGNNISVSFKEGWNRIYLTEDGKNNKFSTKEPDDDMKWYFAELEL